MNSAFEVEISSNAGVVDRYIVIAADISAAMNDAMGVAEKDYTGERGLRVSAIKERSEEVIQNSAGEA